MTRYNQGAFCARGISQEGFKRYKAKTRAGFCAASLVVKKFFGFSATFSEGEDTVPTGDVSIVFTLLKISPGSLKRGAWQLTFCNPFSSMATIQSFLFHLSLVRIFSTKQFCLSVLAALPKWKTQEEEAVSDL